MKKIISAFLVILLAFSSILSVSAAVSAPTDSFSHWTASGQTQKTVVMRPIYEATKKFDARALGLEEEFGQIVQTNCDSAENIYLLTENSEIIVIDKDYNYVKTITVVDEEGNEVKFDGASGFSVQSESEIYIADTNNARVLHCVNGVLKKEIYVPESALIPSDFVYQPTRVAKDSKGYLYVLSAGSYYGIVLYDPNGEFVGFYGANTVKGTILSALSQLWDTLTKNDVKRAKVVKKLPYQTVDICIDKKDFVYTCTGKNAGGNTGQIRRLSPGGTNILTDAESKNFGELDVIIRRNQKVQQNFTSISTDGNGFIFALDSVYGLIYIYDTKSNLIGAFAGGISNGKQTGVFSNASSIALKGTSLVVSDSSDNSITVFERTEYGNNIFDAQQLTLNSDYLGAEPIWQKVNKEDSFNRLALVGLAKAAYDRKDYNASMEYAKKAQDSETYSLALKQKQSIVISDNWTLIFLLSVFLIAGLIALMIFFIKRKKRIIKNDKIRAALTVMLHPFEAFNGIKYKGMGSLLIANIFTILFFVSGVISVTLSNFRYTSFDPESYNSIFELIRTVGLIVLWTLSNWAVCILLHGRGKFKEVYIVTSYSILPMIIYNLLSTVISHLIASSNSTLISGLNLVAIIITGVCLSVGLMIIHDFSFPKVLVTSILTALFMILVIFVLFMIGILLSQFWSFVSNISIELIRL